MPTRYTGTLGLRKVSKQHGALSCVSLQSLEAECGFSAFVSLIVRRAVRLILLDEWPQGIK